MTASKKMFVENGLTPRGLPERAAGATTQALLSKHPGNHNNEHAAKPYAANPRLEWVSCIVFTIPVEIATHGPDRYGMSDA